METPVLIPCQACHGEGRIYHRGYSIDWRDGSEIGGWSEICEICKGDGVEFTDGEEIELEDIADFVAEGFDA